MAQKGRALKAITANPRPQLSLARRKKLAKRGKNKRHPTKRMTHNTVDRKLTKALARFVEEDAITKLPQGTRLQVIKPESSIIPTGADLDRLVREAAEREQEKEGRNAKLAADEMDEVPTGVDDEGFAQLPELPDEEFDAEIYSGKKGPGMEKA